MDFFFNLRCGKTMFEHPLGESINIVCYHFRKVQYAVYASVCEGFKCNCGITASIQVGVLAMEYIRKHTFPTLGLVAQLR